MIRNLFVHPAGAELLHVLGSTMTLLAEADDTDETFEAVLVDTGPGGDLIPHRHPWAELYFVADGTLEVQVGRRTELVGPGALVTLPARCLHAFRVVSERARFLHLSFGRGAVEAFRDFQAHVPGEPTIDDLDAILAVNARHGIELVLPDVALEQAS